MRKEREQNMIKVLDKGYVRLVDHMGSDLTVVNSARVSFNKESFELDEKDRRLIHFLAREGHTSPFRHAVAQFEIYAPLMVARQWWKHVVASTHTEEQNAWNESSRRYVTEEPVFYVPSFDEWRSAPKDKKQGSGEIVDWTLGFEATERLMKIIDECVEAYEWALEQGICAEQARLFLPAYGMYLRWYWTASLQAICHFLDLRIAKDAQKEIQLYAKAILEHIKPLFPVSVEQLVKSIEKRTTN